MRRRTTESAEEEKPADPAPGDADDDDLDD